MKNLAKAVVLLSSLFIGQAYADNTATLIGRSVVTTRSTWATQEKIDLEGRPSQMRTVNIDRSESKDAVMALSDGTMYFISFASIFSRSYAEILKDWNEGDDIKIEYVGGIKAPVNPYKITNVDRGEEIWGKKLPGLK